jgi:hypothetical protein
MEDQLYTLGLALNCMILWNTVYRNAIPARLRANGRTVLDTGVSRLSPYMYAHVNVHGHYTFQSPAAGGRSALREVGRGDDS